MLLVGVAALIRGNSEGAAGLAVLAALVKPQFGVVLVPLVGARACCAAPGGRDGPRNTPWGPARLRRLARARAGAGSHPHLVIGRLAVFFVIALPFAMGPVEYLALVAKTAGGYMDLTVNAYNPWALIGVGQDAAACGERATGPTTRCGLPR